MRPGLLFAALATATARAALETKLHPWNSTAASAVWELAPADDKKIAYTKGGCKDFRAAPRFSLGGNCGPPEPLNASLTSKLYFFAWVSGHEAVLLRHFLVFYTARGVAFKEPGRARLVVSPLKESRQALLDEFVGGLSKAMWGGGWKQGILQGVGGRGAADGELYYLVKKGLRGKTFRHVSVVAM